MAVVATSLSPRHFSITSTRRRGDPRRRALAAANGSSSSSGPAFLNVSIRGSSSRPSNIDPSTEDREAVAGLSCAPPSGCGFCGHCGRRLLLGGISLSPLATLLGAPSAATGDGCSPILSPEERNAVVRPSRPGWYKELYAGFMELGTRSYEAEISVYKEELFTHLRGENKKILELGVGTGPNLKYYANAGGVDIFGVDPNEQMEKYARATARAAGLPPTNFNFVQGVAEALPIRDNSMDAVVGTLVLCSVPDVGTALREVKRVLKPGGLYVFIEHVAAKEGSLLRLLQGALDPLQQFVSDGCHLTRETGDDISQAGFSSVDIKTASVPSASIASPHVYGVACK